MSILPPHKQLTIPWCPVTRNDSLAHNNSTIQCPHIKTTSPRLRTRSTALRSPTRTTTPLPPKQPAIQISQPHWTTQRNLTLLTKLQTRRQSLNPQRRLPLKILRTRPRITNRRPHAPRRSYERNH